MDHPYFHLTIPHLRTATRLPQIPFSQGQPTVPQLTSMLQQMEQQRQQQAFGVVPSVSPRPLPPSHSGSPAGGKPAFGTTGGRTLPPPNHLDPNGSQSRLFFPSGSYSTSANVSPTNSPALRSSASPVQGPNSMSAQGASALMDQLRELDLPTEDLASYGHRPLPSPTGSVQYGFGADKNNANGVSGRQAAWDSSNRAHRGASPYAQDRRGPSSSSLFDGPQQAQTSAASVRQQFDSPYQQHQPQQQHQRSFLPPHMQTPTALASGNSTGQSPYEQHVQMTPRMDTARQQEDVDMEGPPENPSPVYQVPEIARPGLPSEQPKKKKWGMSSVFGKSDSKSSAPSVVEERGSTNNLKRTQSGANAALRNQGAAMAPINPDPPKILDPKEAKAEAKRQAKELEKAKREAAERAQKERARAVMQKRTLIISETKKSGGSGTELEWRSAIETAGSKPANSGPGASSKLGFGPGALQSTADLAHHMRQQQMQQQQQQQQASPSPLPRVQEQVAQRVDHRSNYATGSAASLSQSSVRTPGSHSRLSQQSLQALQAQGSPLLDSATAGAHRAKARRRDDDDDHSMSSFDMARYHNPSIMTVGTIDSDPGPARSPRQYPYDPAVPRATSTSSFNLRQAQLRSNSSLDRQLAHDFATHATVASPSSHAYGSSSSLGRYATSSTSLSGPTTPYNSSMGHAVAGGFGLGRPLGGGLGGGQMLPSISDWEHGGSETSSGVNPMFRVPNPNDNPSMTTLPPFSAIASVADTQPKQQRRDPSN